MAFSSAGSQLIVAAPKEIFSFDVASRAREPLFKETSEITSLTVTRDGKQALVNLSNKELHLWDLFSGKLLSRYFGHTQGRYVIRSCVGGAYDQFILSGSEDGKAYVWHKDSARLVATLPGHAKPINSVSWSPTDIGAFVSGSDDHSIIVWGVKTPS